MHLVAAVPPMICKFILNVLVIASHGKNCFLLSKINSDLCANMFPNRMVSLNVHLCNVSQCCANFSAMFHCVVHLRLTSFSAHLGEQPGAFQRWVKTAYRELVDPCISCVVPCSGARPGAWHAFLLVSVEIDIGYPELGFVVLGLGVPGSWSLELWTT